MEIIISVITGIIIGFVCAFLFFKSRLITIQDSEPARRDATSFAMKLSNELKSYFIEEKDNIKLIVFKPFKKKN